MKTIDHNRSQTLGRQQHAGKNLFRFGKFKTISIFLEQFSNYLPFSKYSVISSTTVPAAPKSHLNRTNRITFHIKQSHKLNTKQKCHFHASSI